MTITRCSVASATLHRHPLVLFQAYIRGVSEVENRNGIEFGRCTAWTGIFRRVHQMDQCLHDGMICGIHIRIQGKFAFPITVVGEVTIRCYNPFLEITENYKWSVNNYVIYLFNHWTENPMIKNTLYNSTQ